MQGPRTDERAARIAELGGGGLDRRLLADPACLRRSSNIGRARRPHCRARSDRDIVTVAMRLG